MAAHLVCDAQEPIEGLFPGPLPALVGAISPHEGRLRGALCVLGVPEHDERVPKDVCDVPPIEALERPFLTAREQEAHVQWMPHDPITCDPPVYDFRPAQ